METPIALAEVYTLVAQRDLGVTLKTRELARAALPGTEGAVRLALLDAIAHALSSILDDIGEHGAGNRALWDWDIAPTDLAGLARECQEVWAEAQGLRSAGVSSDALVRPYVADWFTPLASRDWCRQMTLGVRHHADPAWLARATARLAAQPSRDEQDDEDV